MSVTVTETPTTVTVSPGPTVVVQETTVQVVETAAPTVVVNETVIQVVEVTAGVPNPTLIFKTVDETNSTTSFTNDDELRFEVEEGSTYAFRLTLFADCTNDISSFQRRWDVPTDVTGKWGEGGSSPAQDDLQEAVNQECSNLRGFTFVGTIDATLNGGEVVFQFCNDESAVTGGVTVKAGSFIELFKVS